MEKDGPLGDGHQETGSGPAAGGSSGEAAGEERSRTSQTTAGGWWSGFRRRSALAGSAQCLHAAIVAQARHHVFYENYHVPDTPDGRYDMIVLHAVLVFRRLHADPAAADLAQALFDHICADFDENLREMGVGDLRVGKQVKALAKGLYGRIVAYGSCLDEGDQAGLAAALARNVYRHGGGEPERLAALAAYVRREADRLDGVDMVHLAAGDPAFHPPPPL